MYKIFFLNFNYYSANTSETIEGAKKIARAAGFDSIIKYNDEPVWTYSGAFGFINLHQTIIGLDQTS